MANRISLGVVVVAILFGVSGRAFAQGGAAAAAKASPELISMFTGAWTIRSLPQPSRPVAYVRRVVEYPLVV